MKTRRILTVLFLLLAATLHADVINVKSSPYNAVGDGSNDDTAEIQAALDAVPAAGAEVYVPAGNYKISATLKVKSKTTFRGDGPLASRIFMANADVNIGNVDLIENADQTNGNAGIVIEDLQIDGNKINQTVWNQVIGIDLVHVSDYTIQRVYVLNTVRDCVHISGNTGVRGRIIDSTLRYCGKEAEGNNSPNGGNGISVPSATELIISRNIITDCWLSGIDVETNTSIADDVRRIVVSDNIFRSNLGAAVRFEGESDEESLQVSVTGNQMYSNTEGIRMEYTRGYVIANNSILVTSSHGIFIVGASSIDGTITGNWIYDVGQGAHGIYANTTQQRLTITGNNIQGVSSRMSRAINLPSATNCTVVANTGRGGTDATQIYAPDSSNLVSTNKTN